MTQTPLISGEVADVAVLLPPSRTGSMRALPENLEAEKLGTDGLTGKRPLSEETAEIPRPLRRRTTGKENLADDGVCCSLPAEKRSSQDVVSSLQSIVISLERRPDRMQGCAARLSSRCGGLQYTPFRATDGKIDRVETTEVTRSWHTARNVVYQRQRAIRKGWDDLDTYRERALELTPGERGCAHSHIRAWQYCLDHAGPNGDRPLLVLEDDAAPTQEFCSALNGVWSSIPSDAGVLYLGYSQAAEWRRKVAPGLVEAEYVWTTVAYIVWPAAARILLSQLPVNEPVDNWMAALCATNQFKAYCMAPKIVLQADAWNVNSDVGHSDEHYWGPNSDIHHSDEFYWGPTEESSDVKDDDRVNVAVGSLLWDVDSDDSEESSVEA